MKRPVPTAKDSEFFEGARRYCLLTPQTYASPQAYGSLERRGRIVVFVDALSLYYGELRLQINIDYGLLLQYLVREGRLVHAFFYTGIDLIEQLASRSPQSSSGSAAAQPLSSSDSVASAASAASKASTAPKPPTPPRRRRSPGRRSSIHVPKRMEATRQFLSRLRGQGYRVITKEVQHFPDGSKKLDLDVEIAIDMMKLSESCDRMVLVSGDDTLAYAVKVVSDRGVRSEIVSARDMTSRRLLEVADDYCDLYTIREQIQLK